MFSPPPAKVPKVHPKSLRDHVNKFPRAPEEVRSTILDAIDAWVRIDAADAVNLDDLQKVVAAVVNPAGLCWGPAGELLGNLAGRYPQAQEAVREILRTASATQRARFLDAGLKHCGDDAFRIEILSTAISDRAPRVRIWVAEVCDILGLKEMIPVLEARLQVERTPSVRQALERKLGLLRDGYYASPCDGDPDHWNVIVRGNRGWAQVVCTTEDIQEGRLAEIADRARNKEGTRRGEAT